MGTFSAGTTAEALVPYDRQKIWDVLVDPDLVARFTPFVKKIVEDGDHWRWSMSGLEVLGLGFAPVFSERMILTDLERIEFKHDPAPGAKERAGVNGWYALSEADGGTRLETTLDIFASLPLPRISSPAVTVAMKGVMATMGVRFSKNLLDHLSKQPEK